MSPALLPILLPGAVEDVRVADVDGDGVEELVIASARGLRDPHGLRLSVADVPSAGAPKTEVLELPPEATWWDAGRGLWGLDDEGLRRLDTGERVYAQPTGLPDAPATPAQAGMVVDLDHDGRVELLLRTADALLVVGEDGALWGTAPAAPQVSLERQQEAGGQRAVTTLVPPALAVADVNGDGVEDLLLISPSEVSVHLVAPGNLSGAPLSWPRPPALSPKAEGSELTWARWGDLDGDKKADLLVHRLRTGSLAEVEGELHLLRGTGSALGAAQVVPTGAGSAEAYPVDLDGDGDLDVLIPQVPLDVGNLAQAVFDRSVEVTLTLLPMEGGRLGAPRSLGTMALPVEDSAAAWCMFEDLNGDALPDLAVVVNGALQITPGSGQGLAKQPSHSLELGLPATNLWAADLTGDGVAELIAWAPGERRVVVVRMR